MNPNDKSDSPVAPLAEPAPSPNKPIGDGAYANLLPVYQAIPIDDLLVINLDVTTAVTTVLGSLRAIRKLIAEIHEVVPDIDETTIEKLNTYALALNWANGIYRSEGEQTNELLTLVTEGTSLRELLLTDATALAARRLVDGTRLQETEGPVGYKKLTNDLTILATILKDSWAKIEGKSAVQLEEIDRALLLAEKILVLIGERARSGDPIESSADLRVRAFTLMANTYDRVRQAVSFLRWKRGDTNLIVPSIYGGRTHKAETDFPQPPAPPPAPPAPGPAPTHITTATAPATTDPNTTAAPHKPEDEPFMK